MILKILNKEETEMYDYDVLFLGSGHAAWHGALKLVMAGKKVAFVDGDLIGGTCPQ